MPKGQAPYVPVERKLKAIARELEDKGYLRNPQLKSVGEAVKQLDKAGMLRIGYRHDRDTQTQRFKSRKV